MTDHKDDSSDFAQSPNVGREKVTCNDRRREYMARTEMLTHSPTSSEHTSERGNRNFPRHMNVVHSIVDHFVSAFTAGQWTVDTMDAGHT